MTTTDELTYKVNIRSADEVSPCDAPRPALQKTSSYFGFHRVFLLLALFYFALHHIIMPSCHLILKLN